MLYKTKVEYGDYTMNHVLGCAHGCKFPCYAFLIKKRFKIIPTYENWCQPALVKNTLELLDKELPRLKDRIKTVYLCFTTDPFMYMYEDISDMSLDAIKKINTYGIPCSVLTKGILPIKLAEYSRKNEYGITLVSLSEKYRQEMEPGTAPYNQRIAALRLLHDAGCKTWVSIEPYPTPNIIKQDLNEILEAIDFVDKIIFGRTNYSKKVIEYSEQKNFYNNCAALIQDYCKNHNKQCYIKNGTIIK